VAKPIKIVIEAVDDASDVITKVVNSLGGIGMILTPLELAFDAVTGAAKITGMALETMGAVGVASLGAAVAVGVDFQQSMANVVSVTGEAGGALESMSDVAREWGKVTIFSATESAKAMYYLASAGFDVEETIGALKGTILLAGATMSDLSFTAGTVTAAIVQFGMGADDSARIANAFAAAISKSQLTLERLTFGLKYVAPVAHSLGWSLEYTTAVLGKLNDAGIRGEMAGTMLRSALVRLLKPSRQNTEAMAALGLTLEDLSPVTNSFSDIVDRLAQSGMQADDAFKMFGIRAAPSMLALARIGGHALNTLAADITGTSKAAEMMEIQINTVYGGWLLFISALKEVAITIFNELAPSIKAVLDWLTELVLKIADWLNYRADMIAWGTVIATVFSLVGGAILTFIGFFPMLAIAIFAFMPAIAAIIAGLVFLGIGFRVLLEEIGVFRESWVWTFTTMWQTVTAWAIIIYDAIKKWWEEWIPKIIDTILWLVDEWEAAHGSLYSIAMKWWSDLYLGILEYLEGETGLLGVIGDILDTFIQGDWEKAWEDVKELVLIKFDELLLRLGIWWKDTFVPIMTKLVEYLGMIMIPLFVDLGFMAAKAFYTEFTQAMWEFFGGSGDFPDWWSGFGSKWREEFEKFRGGGLPGGDGPPGGGGQESQGGYIPPPMIFGGGGQDRSSGGGNNIFNNSIILPRGTTDEQAKMLMRKFQEMWQTNAI